MLGCLLSISILFCLSAFGEIAENIDAGNNPAGKSPTTVWRALLFVCHSIDADYTDKDGNPCHLTYTMSEKEVLDGVWSFEHFPSLANNYSNGEVTVEYEIVHYMEPIKTLASIGNNFWWVSPENIRQGLQDHAPSGAYDSVLVLWPQTDFSTGEHIPSTGWGLANSGLDDSSGMTYCTVANAATSIWKVPVVGEVWLHEWLHGICGFYQTIGYPMPKKDADGGEDHGYSNSSDKGWKEFYCDLMTGHISEEGSNTGITPEAWRSGTILSHRNQVSVNPLSSGTFENNKQTETNVGEK
ncbi:MAG: hypothetical protein HQM10_24475 [Candidatus Riflebacteria bacterium]|nr:hypothetical protein [Candidatus Riflebacteria bacterium]